jgi:hypothetical protein
MTEVERRDGATRRAADRRGGDRRQLADRRVESVPVDIERRIGRRRFVERRDAVRRRLNDRRHVLAGAASG